MESRKQDLLTRIEKALPHLSKGQKSIAVYITENCDKAAYMTAAALGNQVGVSESTVVRFAGELGFEGYGQLQAQMRETVRVRMTTVQRIAAVNERIGEERILGYCLAADMENIKSTIESVDGQAFLQAADMILGARNIYVLGMRSSAVLAEFMNYYFGFLFENVRLIRPAGGSEIFEHLMKLHREDVFIAISFPRYTTGIVNATEYAKKTGAKVVAITDSLSSPIVPHADVALVAKSEMVSFVDSLVAPMAVINALIAYIGKKKHGELSLTLDRLEQVWREYNVYTSSGQET